VVRLFTMFLDKPRLAPPRLTVGAAEAVEIDIPIDGGYVPPNAAPVGNGFVPDEPTVDLPLARLAYARSGDKGNSSNNAVNARRPEYLPLIRRHVTPERLVEHMSHLVAGPAQRFEAPGFHALNFLIENALGGGGMASLRIDPQGKAYGQMALEMTIPVPVSWAAALTG
jgi:hypothetical protein